MTATQRTIGRARRRLAAQTALRTLGWSLLVAAGLTAAGLVALHFYGLAAPSWAYAVPAGAAVLVALIVTLARRPRDADVAVLVDKRLELKDSLGTSLYVDRLGDNALTRQVRDDAERAAAGAPVGEAFPVRPTRVWWSALAAAGLAAWLTVDPFSLAQRAAEKRAEAQAVAEQARQIEQALAEAAERAEAFPPREDESPEGGQTPELLDPADLDEKLEAILARRDLSNPEDRRAAAAEVSDLQEKFAEALEQEQDEAQAVQNAMSSLGEDSDGRRGPADRFTDALRRADFEAAQRELATLADQLDDGDLSAAQQRRLAEQFDTLAKQLESAAQQQREAAEREQIQAKQAAEEGGLDEAEQEKLAEDKASADEVKRAMREALEERGLSAEEAQRQAERAQQQMERAEQQAQNNEDAGETAERLAEQMQKLAESVEQAAPDNAPQQEDQPGEQTADGNPNGGQPGQQPGEESAEPPGKPPGKTPGENPGGESGQAQSQQAESGPPSERAEETSGEASGGGGQQVSESMQQAQQELGEAAGQQRQVQDMQSANEQMQEAVQQMAEGSPGGEGEQPSPGEQQAQQPSPEQGQQPGEGQQPGQGQQQAQGRQPGQGQQPGQGGGQGESDGGNQGGQGSQSAQGDGNENGGTSSSQTASNGQGRGDGSGAGGNPMGQERGPLATGSRVERDLQDGTGGRVLTDWTRDGQAGTGESTMTFNQAVREARSEAERAVSEQRVPKRYQRSIKEYFDQLPDAPPAPEPTSGSPGDAGGG